MKSSKSYAVALMDLCKENNNDLNKVVSDLQLVYSLFDEDFVKFLKFPKISKQEKKDVFNKNFSFLDKNILGLLKVLVDNNDILQLDQIINDLIELINEEKGIIVLDVFSTEKLTELNKQLIKNYFSKKLNKEVQINEFIDDTLVGGLVIKYNGKIIDGSLFTKQESLKEYLKK